MYVQPSAPRTIGGVLDDGIRLFVSSLPKVWPLALASAICMLIPNLFFALLTLQTKSAGPQAVLAMLKSPGLWLTGLLLFLLYLALYAALISALNSIAVGNPATLGDAVAVGTRLVPRTFAVAVLLGIGLTIGFMLLLIPGIYMWGAYQLAFIAVVVEDARVRESFSKSSDLVKGYWWRSVTITSIAVVMVLVLSVVAAQLGALTAGLLSSSPVTAVVVPGVIGAVINIFTYTLVPCFALALYHDLKLRHEGGDLAARVDALVAR
jgi:hypothetical protein